MNEGWRGFRNSRGSPLSDNFRCGAGAGIRPPLSGEFQVGWDRSQVAPETPAFTGVRQPGYVIGHAPGHVGERCGALSVLVAYL